MRRIRGKNTNPELIVRRVLHSQGYRYRLHAPELPGRPDIVFRTKRKVIFVHGCFWHRHSNCSRTSTPKTRTDYWVEKFRKNQIRDSENVRALLKSKWRVLIVWECETKNEDLLRERLKSFMEDEALVV